MLRVGLIAFWCSLVSANRAPPLEKSLCSAVHSIASVTISKVANIATDVIILSIPVHALWISATKFGGTERADLLFVFAMGSVDVLAAPVSCVCLKLIQDVPKARSTHTIGVEALFKVVGSVFVVYALSCGAFVRQWRKKRRHRELSSEKGMIVKKKYNEGVIVSES